MGPKIRVSSLLGIGAALLLSSAIPARASLVEVNLFDNTAYDQTSSSAPTSPLGFFFNLGANSANPGDFDSATVTAPNSNVTNLLMTSPSSFGFGSPFFGTLTDLHNTYPFGTYTYTASNSVTMTSQTQTLLYPADAFTTDVPALDPSTFTGLLGLNPTLGFTVDFNAFTPDPSANQGITFFTIHNAANAIVFDAGFLPDTATSVFIPANTLLPNTAYTFELDFSDRIHGFDAVTGVFSEEGFDVRTDGGFNTGSATVPEPSSLAFFGTAAGVLALLRRRSWAKRS